MAHNPVEPIVLMLVGAVLGSILTFFLDRLTVDAATILRPVYEKQQRRERRDRNR